tara:strand:+ start:2256 stop:2465 length:210 start_codon:yes stop_codon:yes gene_type:complete
MSINSLLPAGWTIDSSPSGWTIYDDEGRRVVRGMKTTELKAQLNQLRELQTEWAIATMCEHYRRQRAEA